MSKGLNLGVGSQDFLTSIIESATELASGLGQVIVKLDCGSKPSLVLEQREEGCAGASVLGGILANSGRTPPMGPTESAGATTALTP